MLSIQPEMLYSRTKHISTISRLESMGAFRFVSVKYDPVSDSSHLLDATILLAPSKKLSLNAEVNAVAKTNYFVGPGVKLTFKSRNFLKGGELFTVNLHGRFETQVAGNDKGNTAYEVGTDINLIIPRIIPFRVTGYRDGHVFYTKATVGYNIFQRLNMYQFNTSHASWSYNWKKSNPVSHQLKLIDISFTNLAKATDEFNDWLNINPSLKRSFEEQFILGTSYSYILNHLDEKYKKKYFFRLAADPSGNLMTAVMSIGKKEKPSSDKPYKLFGNPISQFFRALTEARYYINTGEKSIIATRLFIGAGIPYGNSSTIPYVRQFFVGGTNSLRGFTSRSVGPGSYTPPDSLQGLNIDQTGDIKTEANIEYRFPMTKYLKGALFVDVGNVWLVYEDSTRVGAVFDFKRFYKELAISSGIGLRIDFNVVIVRFDLGFPLRKPWLPEGERWVVREINPFDREWRRKNLILNFSVGYPF
jgi:outer membrane protein assembly factor BamA